MIHSLEMDDPSSLLHGGHAAINSLSPGTYSFNVEHALFKFVLGIDIFNTPSETAHGQRIWIKVSKGSDTGLVLNDSKSHVQSWPSSMKTYIASQRANELINLS